MGGDLSSSMSLGCLRLYSKRADVGNFFKSKRMELGEAISKLVMQDPLNLTTERKIDID